jgi:hypothetical protein
MLYKYLIGLIGVSIAENEALKVSTIAGLLNCVLVFSVLSGLPSAIVRLFRYIFVYNWYIFWMN